MKIDKKSEYQASPSLNVISKVGDVDDPPTPSPEKKENN